MIEVSFREYTPESIPILFQPDTPSATTNTFPEAYVASYPPFQAF